MMSPSKDHRSQQSGPQQNFMQHGGAAHGICWQPLAPAFEYIVLSSGKESPIGQPSLAAFNCPAPQNSTGSIAFWIRPSCNGDIEPFTVQPFLTLIAAAEANRATKIKPFMGVTILADTARGAGCN